jgi:hypothetical protein
MKKDDNVKDLMIGDSNKRKYVKKERKDNKVLRSVICLNDEKTFDSLRNAADYYGIDMTGICRACTKPENHIAGRDENGVGRFWMYENEYKEKVAKEGKGFIKERIDKWVKKKEDALKKKEAKLNAPKKVTKKVICLNTKEIFASAAEAAKTYNTHRSSIYESTKRGSRYFSSGMDKHGTPLQWMDYEEYLDKVNKGEKIELDENPRKKHRKSYPVMCIETGEVYPSVLQASRLTDASIYTIRESCRLQGKTPIRKSSSTLHWKYLSDEEYLNHLIYAGDNKKSKK